MTKVERRLRSQIMQMQAQAAHIKKIHAKEIAAWRNVVSAQIISEVILESKLETQKKLTEHYQELNKSNHHES